MKVLHIGTEIHGGAGLGMYRLHQDLLASGVDSNVLCLRRGDDCKDTTLYGFLDDPRVNGRYRRNRFAALLNRMHVYSSPYYTSANIVAKFRKYGAACGTVSSPYVRLRLDNLDLIRDADVVHLHWVADFIDYPSFFSRVTRPIVWTLRDENPMLGFWHVRQDRPASLSPDIEQADAELQIQKARYVGKAETVVAVSLSKAGDAFVAESPTFANRKHCVIPNSVDGDVFYRHDRVELRRDYGIHPETKVLVFVAQDLSVIKKGVQDLLWAVKALERSDIVVMCVGKGELPVVPMPNRVIVLGSITNPERLSAAYSAADLFVSPSYSETFGKTLTEALACGTPVVSYPNNGAKDIVGNGDGVLCEEFSIPSLVKALKAALSQKYDSGELRRRVLARFSRQEVTDKYIALYESLCSKKKV